MDKKTKERIDTFRKNLHSCLESGDCQVIDRGLGTCRKMDGRYCDMFECPMIPKRSEQETETYRILLKMVLGEN